MKKKYLILYNLHAVYNVFILIFNEGLESLVHQLSLLNPIWILVSIALMFSYWMFEAAALNEISGFYNRKKSFKESFSVTMVGQFFNALTPFATGGQPAQVVYLHNKGVDIGDGTAIIMLKFFVYQSVLVVYSLIVILISFPLFVNKIPLLFTMTFFGLAIHASMIIFTIIFSYNKVLTDKIIKLIYRVLKKFKFVKDEENFEKKIEETLSSFHDNAGLLKKNPKLLIKTSLLIFLQLTCYFSIPFFICISFGRYNIDYFYLFAATVFIATIISIVPLPGAAGGAEGGFTLFFKDFFGDAYILTGIIVWRLITYYLCIAFGGLYAVLPNRKSNQKLDIDIFPDIKE